MGDSDDDGDYKRRDKFRTERRGFDDPRRERSEWRDSRWGRFHKFTMERCYNF
jgi:hypothetical protein